MDGGTLDHSLGPHILMDFIASWSTLGQGQMCLHQTPSLCIDTRHSPSDEQDAVFKGSDCIDSYFDALIAL